MSNLYLHVPFLIFLIESVNFKSSYIDVYLPVQILRIWAKQHVKLGTHNGTIPY